MMKLKQLIAAAVLAGASISASAQIVVPWGNHDPAELGGTLFFGTGSSFPFEVVYTFSLTQISDILAVGVTNDAPGVFDISGASASLYQNNGNANFSDDVLVGGFNFDSTAITQTFDAIGIGSYFYKVSGHVDGPFGGSYLLSSHIVPVPEPETYAMLLAGLGLIGFSLRNRRSA